MISNTELTNVFNYEISTLLQNRLQKTYYANDCRMKNISNFMKFHIKTFIARRIKITKTIKFKCYNLFYFNSKGEKSQEKFTQMFNPVFI